MMLPNSRHLRKTATGAVAALLAALLAAGGCGGGKQPAGPRPPTGGGGKAPPTTAPAQATATAPAPIPATSPAPPASAPAASQPADANDAAAPPAASQPAGPDFRDLLAPVAALENDADFSKALIEARKLKPHVRTADDRRLLDETIARITEARSQAYNLQQAAEKLGDGDRAVADVARRRLIQAGEVGRIFLRRALKKGTPEAAAAASEVLAELRDPAAAAVLLARLEKEPRSELTASIMRDMRDMAPKLEPDALARCLKLVASDEKLAYHELVAVFARYLDDACRSRRDKFNQAVGDERAWQRVRDYAERVMVGGSDEAVGYLCDFGGEFRGLAHGLRGRYFADAEFHTPAFERLEATLNCEGRKFPYPDGRQDDLSIRWEGLLQVDRPGTYTFVYTADDAGRLWLDGRKVGDGNPWGNAPAKVSLTAGLHPIRVDYWQVRDNSRALLQWEGPGVARTADLPYRTPPWASYVKDLAAATGRLAAGAPAVVRAARHDLADAGDVGRMFLRHAVGSDSQTLAVRAAGLLAEWDDALAAPVLLDVLKGKPADELGWAATETLCHLVRHIPPDALGELWRRFAADGDVRMVSAAAVLCAVRDGPCAGDPNAFDREVGQAGAAEKLRRYVAAALASKDPAVVARACVFGGSQAPRVPGLRGRYYLGSEWDIPAVEQQDEQVYADNRKFPTPRQYDMSARWDGLVRADKAGPHVFILNARTYAQLFVDGKYADTASGGQDKPITVKLSPGWHAVAVKYAMTEPEGADAYTRLDWQRPGGPRERLNATWLATPPWRAHLEALAAAVGKLAATDEDTLVASRQMLKASGDVGLAYLRNVVRHGRVALLPQTLRLLVEARDAETPALLLARVRTDPNLATAPAVMETLAELPEAIPDDALGGLWQAVKGDSAATMGAPAAALCAVLERRCGADAAKFGKLLGDAAAGDGLKAYVQRAAASKDPAVVARACQFGRPFLPLVAGLHARYYDGADLDKLVLERLDAAVGFENSQFPRPDKRKDRISAAWSGYVRIDKDGQYTFGTYADDASRMYIDGRLAVQTAAPGQWAWAPLTVKAGLHPIRVEFRQTEGDSRLGIGFQNQPMPPGMLLAAPWGSWLAEAPTQVRRLADAKAAPAARAELRRLEQCGWLFLRNAVRDEPPGVAASAAETLACFGDLAAAGTIAARAAADAALADDDKFARALADLSAGLAEADLPALWQAVKADKAGRMIAQAAALCSVVRYRCGGDAAGLGKLAGDGAAGAQLAEYVQRCLASPDPAVAARASTTGQPFAPYLRGLHMTIYDDADLGVPVRELLGGTPYIDSRRLPHPANKQENVSARWTGDILLSAGKWAFQLRADDAATLLVNGREVLSAGPQPAQAALDLPAGMAALRVDWRQTTGDGYLDLNIQGPGMGWSRLPAQMMLTPPWPALLATLPKALREAGGKSAKPEARAALLDLGDVSSIYLRNVLRHESNATALRAAVELLALQRDEQAGPLLVALLGKTSDATLARDILAAMPDLVWSLDRKACTFLHGYSVPTRGPRPPRGRGPAARSDTWRTALLARLLEGPCAGDGRKLNELVGDAKAYDELKAEIDEKLASRSDQQVAWALEHGGPLVPLQAGWRGTWYEGRSLNKPLGEARTASVAWGERRMPSPGNRQDDLSGFWSGVFRVEKGGKYRFYLRADDGGRLWIDGRRIIDNWQGLANIETDAEVELSPGPHRVEVAWWQGKDGNWLAVYWSGPGIGKQPLAAPAVACHVWPDELKAFEEITRKLAAGGGDQNWARDRLREWDGVGNVMLRNVIRYNANEAVIPPAAQYLASVKDEQAAALIGERMARSAKLAADATLVGLLIAAPDKIDPALPGKLLRLLPAREANFEHRELVRLFAAVFAAACGKDKDKFDKLVGVRAYDRVAGYCEEMRASKDGNIVNWANQYGGDFRLPPKPKPAPPTKKK